MLRGLLFALMLLVGSTGALMLAGCARTITPAEVQALAKRSYPGQKRADVVKAATLALKTLGYEVVLSDESTGQVKTAPKPLIVTAAGTGTTAVAASNDMAWSLEITESADGSVVQATPKAISAGTTYDGPLDAEYMEHAIADLFKEIESNLPKAAG